MAGDTNWSSVKVLMHMDDTNLTDVMAHTTSKVGNAARSASQSKFGGYSAAFDGSGDYVGIGSSADFLYGTDPFTIEAWVYIAGNSAQYGGLRYAAIFTGTGPSTSGFGLGIVGSSSTTGTGIFWEDKSTTSISASWAVTVSQGGWHHICCSRSGDTMYLGLDGVVSATSISGGAGRSLGSSSFSHTIGGGTTSGYQFYLNGYIDDLRVTKGVARYTADYTVPDAPFPAYKNYVSGSLVEASDHDEFTIRTHRLDTGAFLTETTATGSAYEVGCCPIGTKSDYAGEVMVSAWPKMGAKWVANTTYATGDYAFPTASGTTPYIFKCTTAGTSHSTTEPTWDDTPGNTTSDSTVTWTCQGRMLQPILHGPLTPSG